MPTNILLETLKVLAEKEKKIKEFKKRLRIRGRLVSKNITKKGNITLIIEKNGEEYRFTMLKTHKEKFNLAKRLNEGRSLYLEGIPKLRFIICTKIKILDKGLQSGKQTKLNDF